MTTMGVVEEEDWNANIRTFVKEFPFERNYDDDVTRINVRLIEVPDGANPCAIEDSCVYAENRCPHYTRCVTTYDSVWPGE